MIRPEEIYARQLYQELEKEFCDSQNLSELCPNIEISIEGAGVHWHCSVARHLNKCTISCFDVNFTNLDYKGAEFYTTFKINEQDVDEGRTFDRDITIAAIKNWIQNKPLEYLYSQYDFIDQEKRELEKIRNDINISNEQLLTISQNEVVIEFLSCYSIWFKDGNRSVKIYYDGYEAIATYIFNWDDCVIFELSSSDTNRLGVLICKWVFEKEMPSHLKVIFPEIEFGKLADYYEKGNGIEGEFILSWDNIEAFYRKLNFDKKFEILELIRQIRSKGFERTLRAGQSLYTLILSRARRHGLRENQNSISFSFGSILKVQTQKGEKFEFDKIEYNKTIEKLLRMIEFESID